MDQNRLRAFCKLCQQSAEFKKLVVSIKEGRTSLEATCVNAIDLVDARNDFNLSVREFNELLSRMIKSLGVVQ